MSENCLKIPLPFHVRRTIRQYKPYLQNAIAESVRAKMDILSSQGKIITAEDISECVGEIVYGKPRRNLRMEAICLEAFDKGEYKTLREVIDELRASIAQSATA